MGAILTPIFCLIYLAAATWFLYRSMRVRYTPAGLVLAVTLVGLAYDSLVIFLGNFIGQGSTLETLNLGRYLAHAALTPLYFLVGGWIALRAEFASASRRMPFLVGATILSILVGVVGFFFLHLVPMEAAGTLRYVVSGDLTPAWAHYAPIGVSVLVNVVFIIIGIGLWRKYTWPWLALGALVMFFAAAVPQKLEFAFLISSVGEITLNIALLATCLRLKA